VSAVAKLARITRSREEWAKSITATWQRAVQHAVQVVIATGQEIIEAKKALPHGEFLAMVKEDLPFSVSQADRLMKIARDTRLANSARVPNLPPSWGTLYELSKASDKQLEQGFETGAIHPAMERKDVAALRGKLRRPLRKKAVSKELTLPGSPDVGPSFDAIDLCSADVRATVFEALQVLPADRHKELFERVFGDLEDLKMKQGL